MSVQTDFVALASPLFSGRLYPAVAPAGVTAPYATYTRVTAIEQSTLDANGGAGNSVNTRLQVDVWALTYLDAQGTAGALKTALKGWALENIVLAEQDGYENDTRLHRVMLDVSIWHL